MRSPGRGSRRTDGSQKRPHATHIRRRLIGLHTVVCATATPSGRQKLRQCLARRRQPLTSRANYPIAMRVRPCNPPPPRLIERLEAAQVNVQAGIIPAWMQYFRECDKKDELMAVSGRP